MSQDAINGIVAGLKGKMGLPTADVNSGGGSSPQPNANQNLPASPAKQVENAADILSRIQSAESQHAPEDKNAAVLAAKDQAISDLKAQIEGLAQGQQVHSARVQELLDKLTPKDAPAGVPEPQLPHIPDDFNEKPADQQLQTLVESFNNLRTAVAQELKTKDENLKKFLGPMSKEVFEVAQMKDKQLVAQAYPGYDWDTNKEDYDKLRYAVPHLTAVEAAAVIAARKDPKQLLPVEQQAPVAEPSLPSPSTAATRPGLQDSKRDDSAHITRDLIGAIGNAHSRNQASTAGQLMDALLKHKLFGKVSD